MLDSSRKKAWFGWCMYDWANSAFATVILASVLPVYFASLVPPGGAHVTLLGWQRTVPTTALWGYAVSFSMLLVDLPDAHPSPGDHDGPQGLVRPLRQIVVHLLDQGLEIMKRATATTPPRSRASTSRARLPRGAPPPV